MSTSFLLSCLTGFLRGAFPRTPEQQELLRNVQAADFAYLQLFKDGGRAAPAPFAGECQT
ncbi:hypothetical protein D9V29_04820 [Mycetocola manganoxydans]|uniref:Uncharacterized protein n=1 Tax=Mycetocola manganoxydans TaxID=699879 RepID=A0A3L6ZY99_9MICO|nr:hypothetical protein D9V29_04820 [Mycetocola manganoxydans]